MAAVKRSTVRSLQGEITPSKQCSTRSEDCTFCPESATGVPPHNVEMGKIDELLSICWVFGLSMKQ